MIDGRRGITPFVQGVSHIEPLLQNACLEIVEFSGAFTTIHENPPSN